MRNLKQIFKDIVRKPPILFPLVAAFHVLWVLWLLWDDRREPFPDIVWLQVLWMLLYTTFWIAACDLRKWGAIGYIVLTIVDGCVFLMIRNHRLPPDYLSNIFLIDGLLSICLFYYFKKFK